MKNTNTLPNDVLISVYHLSLLEKSLKAIENDPDLSPAQKALQWSLTLQNYVVVSSLPEDLLKKK